MVILLMVYYAAAVCRRCGPELQECVRLVMSQCCVLYNLTKDFIWLCTLMFLRNQWTYGVCVCMYCNIRIL